MKEGFSIREYATRMRSLNMLKSWPFDDFTTEQTVNSLLPPITVKKFSWWLDELEYSRSVMAISVANSKKKKKIVEGKGETSLRGLEESDMDVEASLGVVKAPKKRSIVEIFAAAALSMEEKDNYDKELDGFSANSKWGFKGKRNEKNKENKKNKETMLSKLKNTKKARDNFKIKKRRGDNEMDVLVPNKEKRTKLKPQAQDIAIRNLNPLCNKESECGVCDHVSVHKTKSRPHGLDADTKTMAHKAYKLMSKNQYPILPRRGILKNHSKVISVQKEPIQLTHRGKQKENKHVTFVEKDDIIKLARKSLFSVECLKVPILNGSDMDAVDASFCEDDAQGIEKDPTLGETGGIEELSNGIQKEINIGHSCKEPSTFHWCCIDTNNYLKQHEMDEFFSGSVASDKNTLHGIKKYLFESGLKEAPQIPVHEINNMPQVLSQSKIEDLFSHPSPYQTFPSPSPNEFINSLCSLTNGKRGYLCEKKSIYDLTESFLGLPLTSQGELIKLNSSVDGDFCQMKSSITADPSPSLSTCINAMSKCLGNHSGCRNWDCRTSVDQLNLCPFEDNLKARPPVVPSSFDFSECQSNGKGNCDLGLIKMHPFQPDKSTSDQNDQMQKFPGNEKIISTVRLMGKEFVVSGRLGELRDTLTCPSEMKFPSESMHSLPQFHGQTTIHKNNFPVQNLYATVSPDASFTVNRRNWLHTPKSAITFPFMHPDLEGHVLSSRLEALL